MDHVILGHPVDVISIFCYLCCRFLCLSLVHHTAAVVTPSPPSSLAPIISIMETFWYQLTQVHLKLNWLLKWREIFCYLWQCRDTLWTATIHFACHIDNTDSTTYVLFNQPIFQSCRIGQIPKDLWRTFGAW